MWRLMKLPVVFILVLTILGLGESHPFYHHRRPSPKLPFIWQDTLADCSGKFVCGNCTYAVTQQCVEADRVCDPKPDCHGEADEDRCRSEPRCPDGILCQDKRTCAKPCNKDPECPDHEDEMGCPFTCPDKQYKCPWEEKCISLDKVCDGKPDCFFAEDEKKCEPQCHLKKMILCADKKTCATPCNGIPECGATNEDEADCPFHCGEGQYECTNEQKCIDPEQICDKSPDCIGGEDESNCHIPCPLGWLRYQDSCYFFSGREELYADARAYCEAEGSQLVTIDDAGENDFLKLAAENHVNGGLYIGLNDIDGDDVYRWILTGEAVGFEDWAMHEPFPMNGKCALMERVNGYQWVVNECIARKRRFVCELPVDAI